MKQNRITIVCLILTSIVSGALAATTIQERKTKMVTRVARPIFSARDWDGIYFEDLFSEGLVGNRPESLSPGARATGNGQSAVAQNDDSDSGEFAWSKLIGRATIEDEVKSIQKTLAIDITTPVKFKSDYAKVNYSFTVLSMIFGIIREYDAEVRWSEAAAEAQVSFERAAANSRVGTIQAFESCRRRAVGLEDMVRGGKFVGEEKAPAELDWGTVADRSPLMNRLEASMDHLKILTANKAEFSREIAVVNHEIEMVAAIGAALVRENMTDADDSGYAAFAVEMKKSAIAAANGVKANDYDAASRAVNMISQSCDNCHAEWR